MPDTFDFLAASLAAIERDAPACARAMADALGPASVALAIDAERMTVRAGAAVVVEPGAPGEAPVEVATTAAALRALLAGDDELFPAILANRVRVRAAPHDAARLFDAMRRFVEGCARTSAAPALLADYQANRRST